MILHLNKETECKTTGSVIFKFTLRNSYYVLYTFYFEGLKFFTFKRAKLATLVQTKLILWMSELLTVSNVNENDMERVASFLKSQIFGDLLLYNK